MGGSGLEHDRVGIDASALPGLGEHRDRGRGEEDRSPCVRAAAAAPLSEESCSCDQDSQNRGATSVIRVLGLDVGSVRVGVALSDPLGMTAQPLEVIERRKRDPFARVAELVAENEVQRIVVGMPLRLDGSSGPAVEAIEKFIDELRAAVSVPIETWDERLSTAQAQRSMIAGGVRRKQRKERIDKVAAALILQSFLDAQGGA